MGNIIFTSYFEGSFHEWSSIEQWYAEQRNFDRPEACLDILEALYQDGSMQWSGIDYRLVDRDALAQALRPLSEKVVWEEGLDQSYLFTV